MSIMMDDLYDEAYGPLPQRKVNAMALVDGMGFKPVLPHVVKQVVEDTLPCVCWCGRTVIEVSRLDVLEGQTGYCSVCDPNWYAPKEEPKPTKEEVQTPKKTSVHKLATYPQLAYAERLISQMMENDTLTDDEWEYVYGVMTNYDAEIHQVSKLINFLRLKLKMRS